MKTKALKQLEALDRALGFILTLNLLTEGNYDAQIRRYYRFLLNLFSIHKTSSNLIEHLEINRYPPKYFIEDRYQNLFNDIISNLIRELKEIEAAEKADPEKMKKANAILSKNNFQR